MIANNRRHVVVSIALLSALAIRPSFAGDDSDVDAGIAALEQQDHETAIRELEQALAEPAALQAANVPRARYHLGKALLAAYVAQGQPTTGPLAEAPIRAADAYLEVRASGGEECAAKAESEVEGAALALAAGAAAAFSAPGGEGQTEVLARADRWLGKAIELLPHSYAMYDMRGQIREMAGRRDGAYQDFQEALAQYRAHPSTELDPFIGFTAVRAAMLTRAHKGDPVAALAEVEEGQAILEAQRAQLGTAPADLQQVFAEATSYLERARLDILLNTPELREKALRDFETAVQENPDDYKILTAYASLLEHTDPPAAIAMYERAIAADRTQFIAHFNLGTIYFNRGSRLFNQANLTEDYDAVEALEEQGLAEMRKARPHLENALSISPDDGDTLRALKQVTLNLGDMEAYEVYRDRFFELN